MSPNLAPNPDASTPRPPPGRVPSSTTAATSDPERPRPLIDPLTETPRIGRTAGLRLQLVLALGALAVLAFVPLFLAVASLTRHTLRANREDVARSLGRAVVGRLWGELATPRALSLPTAGRSIADDDERLREVALVSLEADFAARSGGKNAPADAAADGVVAIRIERPPPYVPIEVGQAATIQALRHVGGPLVDGERTIRTAVDALGPVLDIEIAGAAGRVQVALRVGDQASRAAPLLRLIAFYTAAFAIVLIVFAYLLLTRLIVRPIGALAAATSRLAARDAIDSLEPIQSIQSIQSIPSMDSMARRRLDLAPFNRGAREVAELGGAIERTTARLVEREESLAAKVRQLEAAKADLVAARDAIVRSERLASVGRLSAGLAHEVGNPIAALLGLEDVLLGGDLDAHTRDMIGRMRRETDRVHRIMRDLLDFARAGQHAARPDPDATSSLASVVDEVVALLEPQRSMRDIAFVADISADLPPLRMSAGQLLQVLLNLVMNAADAIGGAPPSAPRSPGDDASSADTRPIGTIFVRGLRAERGLVRIEVSDTGPGISEEIRASLFEPFVTTKEIGKGTGLGLAVCRGVVEAAGGEIEVAAPDPTRAGGACFVIVLPAAERASED